MLESPWPYHVSSPLLTHHRDSSQSRHSPLKVLATKAGDLSLIPIMYVIQGENCPYSCPQISVLWHTCVHTQRNKTKQIRNERKK